MSKPEATVEVGFPEITAAKIEYIDPIRYRLKRSNGELILQGAFRWEQGRIGGIEWFDIPTIEGETT